MLHVSVCVIAFLRSEPFNRLRRDSPSVWGDALFNCPSSYRSNRPTGSELCWDAANFSRPGQQAPETGGLRPLAFNVAIFEKWRKQCLTGSLLRQHLKTATVNATVQQAQADSLHRPSMDAACSCLNSMFGLQQCRAATVRRSCHAGGGPPELA